MDSGCEPLSSLCFPFNEEEEACSSHEFQPDPLEDASGSDVAAADAEGSSKDQCSSLPSTKTIFDSFVSALTLPFICDAEVLARAGVACAIVLPLGEEGAAASVVGLRAAALCINLRPCTLLDRDATWLGRAEPPKDEGDEVAEEGGGAMVMVV